MRNCNLRERKKGCGRVMIRSKTHLVERRFERVHFVDPTFHGVSVAFSVGAATVKSNVVGIDDKL